MSDESAIKAIMESKAKQNLRTAMNESKDFKPSNSLEQKALDEYNQMTEEDKRQFNSKGWVND